MKRKKFIAIMISTLIAATSCMLSNRVNVLAAENAEAEMTEDAGFTVMEEFEQDKAESIVGELSADGFTEEEVGDAEGEIETEASDTIEETQIIDAGEETTTADTIEAQSAEETAEQDAEFEAEINSDETIAEPESVLEDETPEEVNQQDVMEDGIDNYTLNDKSYGTAANTDEKPLPASTKVTTTNVASGLKVRWEPVSGAREYVVYRGSKLIKRTSKTEITDTDVKNSNGKKYTYKVAAVSRTGKVSNKTRTSTYYRLLPVGITSVKQTGDGEMVVNYGKNAKGSGYVIRFDTEKSMEYATVLTVKDPGKTSRAFGGLMEEMTYYVQVRSYIIENGTRYYSGYCTTKSVKILMVQNSINRLEPDHEYTSLDVTGDGKRDRFKISMSGWDRSTRPGYTRFSISLNGKTAYQYTCPDGEDYFRLEPTLFKLNNGKVFLFISNNDGEDHYYSPFNMVLQYNNGKFVTAVNLDKIYKPHCISCTSGPISVSGNNVTFHISMFSKSWAFYNNRKGYFDGHILMQYVYQDGTLKEKNSAAQLDSDYSRMFTLGKKVSAYTNADRTQYAFTINKGETVTADQCRITSSKMLLRVKKGSQYGWILLGDGVLELD